MRKLIVVLLMLLVVNVFADYYVLFSTGGNEYAMLTKNLKPPQNALYERMYVIWKHDDKMLCLPIYVAPPRSNWSVQAYSQIESVAIQRFKSERNDYLLYAQYQSNKVIKKIIDLQKTNYVGNELYKVSKGRYWVRDIVLMPEQKKPEVKPKKKSSKKKSKKKKTEKEEHKKNPDGKKKEFWQH